ncbi:uncharacterized protein LOC115889255 [Sitophilus oryzae]|uniref:Uncharacterized protein LOC115889255 n=1 Tax=Sitophilus oryzae TaxID=7048 RepID=A0A6J2YQI9_SITOR|nr:uncharacterized protein LOC115889255 [Sitophilus oryzae]
MVLRDSGSQATLFGKARLELEEPYSHPIKDLHKLVHGAGIGEWLSAKNCKNILTTLSNTIRNKDLWSLTNQKQVYNEIKLRKWRWIGYTLRRSGNNITGKAIEWNPEGSRRTSRPKHKWQRTIKKDIEAVSRSWRDVKSIANNRTRWRAFVETLCFT